MAEFEMPWPKSTTMPVLGIQVPNPPKWDVYVSRYPEIKDLDPKTRSAEKMTDELWRVLVRCNREVNAFVFQADVVDDWDHTLPGDCENIAFQKRLRLSQKHDFHMGALRPALLAIPNITYSQAERHHMVLLVFTDKGTYVMDNLVPFVMPWERYPVRRWIACWAPEGKWDLLYERAK